MDKTNLSVSVLDTATTDELVAELTRRSLGCIIVSLRGEESGEVWRMQVKGSRLLVGAMLGALQLEVAKTVSAADQPAH